jgi:hypothetical protein
MKELRNDIAKALKDVTVKNAPTVYEEIQSTAGYKKIEDMIIHMMIDESMTASACIPHIESQI